MKYDEQLEKQNLELRDKLDGALYQNEKMGEELRTIRECYDILYSCVEEFSEFGCRHDTNPTLTSFDKNKIIDTYLKQLKSQEQYVKQIASDILARVNKYMSDADVV